MTAAESFVARRAAKRASELERKQRARRLAKRDYMRRVRATAAAVAATKRAA